MKKVFVQGTIRECCKIPDNLELQPTNKPELIIKKCKVCDRKHHTLIAEPGTLKFAMK